MKLIFDILRRKSRLTMPYHQRIPFETADPNETVATALQQINRDENIRDEQGNPVESVQWEAGCLQKKCGACAMLINGYPGLACDAFLWELCGRRRHGKGIFELQMSQQGHKSAAFEKKEKTKKIPVITLAPLGKFPVVADLVTDRSILFTNLKTLQIWSTETAEIKEKDLDMAYDASRCLQCGCCLEACPNFYAEGSFAGAAGYAPEARLISTYSESELKKLKTLYQEHIYQGCGKSLACAKVCPAKIDLDRLMSRSNAAIIWGRRSARI